MTTRVDALMVRCLHCGSAPGAPCLTPTWPGKGEKSRRPLTFHPAHPVRVALAAAMAAGASDAAGVRAARIAVRSDHHDYEIPWLDVALAAVEEAERGAALTYRKLYPAEPDLFDKTEQPTLELGL